MAQRSVLASTITLPLFLMILGPLTLVCGRSYVEAVQGVDVIPCKSWSSCLQGRAMPDLVFHRAKGALHAHVCTHLAEGRGCFQSLEVDCVGQQMRPALGLAS